MGQVFLDRQYHLGNNNEIHLNTEKELYDDQGRIQQSD